MSAVLFSSLISAQAQDHAAPASTNLLSPSGGLMFWTLIIFLILFFVLSKFAFKPITAAVEARERALSEAIAAAQRDRDEAAKILAEHRAKIEEARMDAQRIISEGRATGDKLRQQMLDDTRQQQTDLLDRARKEIESEKVKAIRELRREAVDLAIAGASKVLERNLDAESNRRIVEEYLSSLEKPAAR